MKGEGGRPQGSADSAEKMAVAWQCLPGPANIAQWNVQRREPSGKSDLMQRRCHSVLRAVFGDGQDTHHPCLVVSWEPNAPHQ